MSIEHCDKCGKMIDTDFNAEHFDEEVEGCEDTYEEKLDETITYPKCPVCTSANIREINKNKVECATCHTEFATTILSVKENVSDSFTPHQIT